MRVVDISNFTDELSDWIVQSWLAQGVGLVIFQAFPPYYGQYAEQRRQMRVLARNGVNADAYVYDYLGDPTWLDGAIQGLFQARAEEGLYPQRLWLDEEDVETERGWSPAQRVRGIVWSLERAAVLGLPLGIYTGQWWWIPLTGNWTGPADEGRGLWDSFYDGLGILQSDRLPSGSIVPFQSYGGWAARTIKQYVGTTSFAGVQGVDLGVADDAAPGEETGDVVIPQEYVDKFHLADDHDVGGLIGNFEGIVHMLVEQVEALQAQAGDSVEAQAALAVAEDKLAKVREVVNG